MPPRDSRDLAHLLLRKAAIDVEIVSTLMVSETPYEAVGFHAQQSCEKALKAVLAAAGVGYPHTHNIAVLVDLLRTVRSPFLT